MASFGTGKRGAVEWPTILLAIVIHGGWLAATWGWHRIPGWTLPAIGGWLVAWHGSLQHETIHGHPTRRRWLNTVIAGLPLSVWLPYASYRRDHLAHHRDEIVTDPLEDPETRYLLPGHGRARRVIACAQATLAGRLLLGPPIQVAAFLAGEAARLRRDPATVLRDWTPHLAGLAAIGAWLSICGMPPWVYLAAFVYPGTALSLLRSYAEHRAAAAPGHRVAIVERAGPFALLFLNNNLHAAHHRAPGLPWFALPGFYRRHRAVILHDNGGLLYRGYGEVARRFALRRHDVPVHPFAG